MFISNRYIFRVIKPDGTVKHYGILANSKKEAKEKASKVNPEMIFVCDNERSISPAYDDLMSSVPITWIH